MHPAQRNNTTSQQLYIAGTNDFDNLRATLATIRSSQRVLSSTLVEIEEHANRIEQILASQKPKESLHNVPSF
jgi:predicted LPLAT superfamily acyltransferase